MSENDAKADVIQAWLVSKLSERLGIAPSEIDIREHFASYGLGSTDAVGLTGELAAWLGRNLSPALVYEHSTIEALARHLGESPAVPEPAMSVSQDNQALGEPIAIIGIGCRFPGANDPAEFWQLMRNGVDAIREVPADRFDQRAFYDPNPDAPGKMNTRWGGFLGQDPCFDDRPDARL
jgi:acyl carrier protein